MGSDPATEVVPAGRCRTIRLVLEYDGSLFAGWQVQPGQRTVQGELEHALLVLCRHPVTVQGAGRTDAGVHARGQVATFETTSCVATERLLRGIAGLCRPGLVALDASEARPGFHARFSATGKVYAYRILARDVPSPLLRGRVWHVRWPLDLDVLAAELATLPGEADWSAFRAADCGSLDPRKTLRRADLVREQGEVIALVFEGSGFLKQMVRILAGTAVEVARGRMPPGAMRAIRDGRSRAAAGPTAPPEGLYLERVIYAER